MAIEDIAALGFHGIQLRANVVKEFDSFEQLRELLGKNRLKLVALSSGGVSVDRLRVSAVVRNSQQLAEGMT